MEPAVKHDTDFAVLTGNNVETKFIKAGGIIFREGDNAHVGSFRIGANLAAGIDGVSETDGLDVSSMAAGPNFPHGLMVAQDGRNVFPPENQNFKLVPWEHVAKALGIDVER